MCVYLCSCLSYPACKAQAPYYIVMCGLLGSNNVFTHHLVNDTIGRNKSLNIKTHVAIFSQSLPETFPILRRIQRNITNVPRSSRKVPLFLVRFEWNLNFLDIFSESTQILSFMKIRPVGVEFAPCGRTVGQQSLYAVLRTRLKTGKILNFFFLQCKVTCVHTSELQTHFLGTNLKVIELRFPLSTFSGL